MQTKFQITIFHNQMISANTQTDHSVKTYDVQVFVQREAMKGAKKWIERKRRGDAHELFIGRTDFATDHKFSELNSLV